LRDSLKFSGLVVLETPKAALLDETSTLVSSIALAIVRDFELSRDVAQDVFLSVWRDLKKLRNLDSLGSKTELYLELHDEEEKWSVSNASRRSESVDANRLTRMKQSCFSGWWVEVCRDSYEWSAQWAIRIRRPLGPSG
jgi:hypothetical protein